MDLIKGNSWKEEIAIALVVYLMYLGIVNAVGVLEILIWPFIVFITAAFGLRDAMQVVSDIKPKGGKL